MLYRRDFHVNTASAGGGKGPRWGGNVSQVAMQRSRRNRVARIIREGAWAERLLDGKRRQKKKRKERKEKSVTQEDKRKEWDAVSSNHRPLVKAREQGKKTALATRQSNHDRSWPQKIAPVGTHAINKENTSPHAGSNFYLGVENGTIYEGQCAGI